MKVILKENAKKAFGELHIILQNKAFQKML